MSCSSCKYLNDKDRKAGAVSGAKYYCTKKGTYVYGTDECNDYEKSYIRKSYECDEIYKDGKNFYDDDRSLSSYVFILISMLILLAILNIF